MKFSRILFCAMMACEAGCIGSAQHAARSGSDGSPGFRESVDAQKESIAPGRCRIVAKVVSIENDLDAAGSGPCSKAPCRATVRVDSVLGYGSSFGPLLAAGQDIHAEFAFTLAATSSELFPNMSEHYPGLQVGSAFQTDIESRQELGTGAGSVRYVVHGYRKLN